MRNKQPCGKVSASEKQIATHLRVEAAAVAFSVRVTACVAFPYTTRWEVIQTFGLFISGHTCNTHTSLLFYRPAAFALGTETVWIRWSHYAKTRLMSLTCKSVNLQIRKGALLFPSEKDL